MFMASKIIIIFNKLLNVQNVMSKFKKKRSCLKKFFEEKKLINIGQFRLKILMTLSRKCMNQNAINHERENLFAVLPTKQST